MRQKFKLLLLLLFYRKSENSSITIITISCYVRRRNRVHRGSGRLQLNQSGRNDDRAQLNSAGMRYAQCDDNITNAWLGQVRLRVARET